jgi:hypothetical protein
MEAVFLEKVPVGAIHICLSILLPPISLNLMTTEEYDDSALLASFYPCLQ